MKNIKIVIGLFLLVRGSVAFSQCPDYTHTDPNATYVQPSGSGFIILRLK